MKILLVNPTPGAGGEYGALAEAGTELPQLGIAYVASSLEHAGHEVRIVDKAIHRLDDADVVETVAAEGTEIVGMSVYVTTRKATVALAERIKVRCPEVRVVVGGPEATLDPEYFLRPAIDAVFLGEADESIVAYAAALGETGLRHPVPGVLERCGDAFAGERTPRLVEDLDALPPLRLERYYNLDRIYPPVHILGHKAINLLSVRGCPFQCTFCAAAEVSGRRLRCLKNDRFLDQIACYLGMGFDSFSFYDDTFSIRRDRTRDFCRKVCERGLRFVWNCFTRVDCIDPETLEWMRRAGCTLVTFGIESFNDKTLTKLKKGFTAEQAREGVAMVRDAGIAAQSSFMFGLPGETVEDMRRTLDAALDAPLTFALFPVFEPYKGTPIYADCEREGEWKRLDDGGNLLLVEEEKVWVPHAATRKEIVALSQEAMRCFYLRPRAVARVAWHLRRLPLSRWLRVGRVGAGYFLGPLVHRVREGGFGTRFK